MKGRMVFYPSFFRMLRIFPFVPYSLFNMAIGATVKCGAISFTWFNGKGRKILRRAPFRRAPFLHAVMKGCVNFAVRIFSQTLS